ncbi:MAG: nucleotidyl transferase AbiEii/AbiGii toxin family protein [Firmicutes bacterium]|nr:nucleotidyl transferase AbiEii/AbiGii toxin family protein [Bacillota bacterium]
MWFELLKKAFSVLKASEIKDSEWTFGGGTALALIFRHRESRDVDIFFSDAQMLTLITPRLKEGREADRRLRGGFIVPEAAVRRRKIDFLSPLT